MAHTVELFLVEKEERNYRFFHRRRPDSFAIRISRRGLHLRRSCQPPLALGLGLGRSREQGGNADEAQRRGRTYRSRVRATRTR